MRAAALALLLAHALALVDTLTPAEAFASADVARMRRRVQHKRGVLEMMQDAVTVPGAPLRLRAAARDAVPPRPLVLAVCALVLVWPVAYLLLMAVPLADVAMCTPVSVFKTHAPGVDVRRLPTPPASQHRHGPSIGPGSGRATAREEV